MKKKTLIVFLAILTTEIWGQTRDINSINKFSYVNNEIISLFKEYPLVAIGEGFHNSALTSEWLESLIHEKYFSKNVRNIVVEFGTSKYQSVMDDFVLRGKQVPDSLLKKCWRNTTQMYVWDNPIYENFFREIKKINADLPTKHKIRILLADLPFERRTESTDEHAFHIIKNEVLKKKQTALLLFGDLHFIRRDVFLNYSLTTETPDKQRTLVQLLDLHYPEKVFSVWGSVNTNDPMIKKIITDDEISYPSFHITSKSKLGLIDFTAYYPWADERTDAKGNPVDSSQYVSLPIKEIVNGILFRGLWEDQIERIAPRPDEIYADTAYINELIARAKISGELGRQITFEYFKLRWSTEYEPFLKALEIMAPSQIDNNFLGMKNKYPEFQWMSILNRMGYQFLRDKKENKAIAIFELATREFPTVANTFDSLGDGYMATGNKEKAITSYTKSLQLNPNNQRTKNKLKKLNNN